MGPDLTLKIALYSNLLIINVKHIKLFAQCDEHLFFSVPGVHNH